MNMVSSPAGRSGEAHKRGTPPSLGGASQGKLRLSWDLKAKEEETRPVEQNVFQAEETTCIII